MWWSRIGDKMVVMRLPNYSKHKLEFSFDCFLSFHHLPLLVDIPEPVSDSYPDLICLAILFHIAPVPNKVQIFNVQPPPGSAWVISCNPYIVQGYAGHYDMPYVL